MLQHAVLVNSRFVRERVFTDNRLIAGHVHARDAGHQARGGVEPGRLDTAP
jgi:hypothetical protein